MKPLLFTLLAVSLVANVVLSVRSRHSASSPSSDASAPVSAPGTMVSSTTPDQSPASGLAEGAPLAQTWAQLPSGDLKGLVGRLRTAGFSESMIRAIIAAQVNEQFSARRKALLAQQEETPYWNSPQRFGLDPKTMSALRELNREQKELLQQLLGPDGATRNDERQAYQRRQYGPLAQDKVDQLQNIVSDYGELRQQIYSAANGVILPEDREKLTLLEKEQRADLAAMLTPQELENYELRRSSTASLLHSQLGTFKPTEEEFRAIFHATRAAENQFGSISPGGGTQIQQIRTAVLDQAKILLTPERFADLKQATDPVYQQVNRLVARLELPASAAIQIVAVQQDIAKRAGALRADSSLSPAQRNIQLSGLLQEATTNLTAALGGARGLEAYKQYGGQWLQILQPRPVQPPKG